MKFEKGYFEKHESKPKTQLIKSEFAPQENQDNPFFNKYFWGMLDWDSDMLYLPSQSDEAISFSIASHELGHLVKKGQLKPDREDFKTTYQEELRAWNLGWDYLSKHLPIYYKNKEDILALEDIKNKVQDKLMSITELSKSFYEKKGFTNELEQRVDFLSTETGLKIKQEIDDMENWLKETLLNSEQEKFLSKIDWDKYLLVINKALMDIEADNEKQ